MNIRRANDKDIPRLIELLQQVLEIHAGIRPDIFISGTTKYTHDELLKMTLDDEKPIYVAVDEDDRCVGYAFCQLREQPFSNNMVPFKSLFIDDLCVDSDIRGQHVGEHLFEFVKSEAERLGCYEARWSSSRASCSVRSNCRANRRQTKVMQPKVKGIS